MKFRTLAALFTTTTVALLTAQSANAAVVAIDNFTDRGSASALFTLAPEDVGPVSQTATGLSGVFGGSRTITLSQVAPVSSGTTGTFVTTTMPLNSFEYQSSSNRDGLVSLTYNLSSLNLSPADLTSTIISFIDYDVPSTGTLNISVTASFTGSGPDSSIAVPYIVPGSNIANLPVVGLVGTGTITTLTVNFDAPLGGDFVIDNLSLNVVPEPAAAAVVMPLTLLALRRRR